MYRFRNLTYLHYVWCELTFITILRKGHVVVDLPPPIRKSCIMGV